MRLSRFLSLGLLAALLVPSLAWKGATAAGVLPISEVLAKAESGDVVTIEGQVVDSTTGSGSLLVATFQDETASVLVAVPDSQMRMLDVKMGEAAGGQRYRVTGRWGHQHMDEGTWGIYAQQIERVTPR
jgi:hypothetical protein